MAGIVGGDGGSTVTIGVSIAVPEPYAAQVQDARAGYGDPLARAIPTHVTLLPPTEVPAARLDAVAEHLAAAAEAQRPFQVLLHGSGSFRPVSPVVYVRLAAGVRECRTLEAAVRSGLLARELAFPYHPHVTVAQAVAEPLLDRAYQDFRDYRAEFAVTGFSLYLFGADRVWRPRRDFAFAVRRGGSRDESRGGSRG
ncbi:2'-5' RNA ligase family protein [Streptacidiphilus sp. P02-A3a]|uniref:2'-5' RNA ligase family protein n=1 Tax=Streptacidiphilus sp. P02-A3a TaxID=2704468 RepID=UPI0015FCFA35|nr:2'-5' RNA ligase family protein [Streptacidiphilus sp. P02-A3a]QMU72639.1 2'-5' RNA ligase family protein [Streptacidiphilus sp. P02-A3a]